jgi:hypothetical protein
MQQNHKNPKYFGKCNSLPFKEGEMVFIPKGSSYISNCSIMGTGFLLEDVMIAVKSIDQGIELPESEMRSDHRYPKKRYLQQTRQGAIPFHMVVCSNPSVGWILNDAWIRVDINFVTSLIDYKRECVKSGMKKAFSA